MKEKIISDEMKDWLNATPLLCVLFNAMTLNI